MLCFSSLNDPGFVQQQKRLALEALDTLRSLGLSPEGLIIMLRGGDPSEDAQQLADEVYDSIAGQIAPGSDKAPDGMQPAAPEPEGGSGDGGSVADGLLEKAEDIKNDARDLAAQAGNEAARKVNEIVEEEKESFLEYFKERVRRRLHDFVDSVF